MKRRYKKIIGSKSCDFFVFVCRKKISEYKLISNLVSYSSCYKFYLLDNSVKPHSVEVFKKSLQVIRKSLNILRSDIVVFILEGDDPELVHYKNAVGTDKNCTIILFDNIKFQSSGYFEV